MSRGFSVVATVNSADELTPEKIADEVAANGLLSAVELTDLLPGAIDAAKAALAHLTGAPFVVRLLGEDHTTEPGEFTSVTVTVGTWVVQSPSPEVLPAVESQATSETSVQVESEPSGDAPSEPTQGA